MARSSPRARVAIRANTPKVTDGSTGDAAVDSTISNLTKNMGTQIASYGGTVAPPKARIAGKGIVDIVKSWMKPKNKPAAPPRAPASPFPALTNAQRDSLSKKYLGK